MSIQMGETTLTDVFEEQFETDVGSYHYGCGIIDKSHTVYVGFKDEFEEDDEVGFNLSKLSERAESVEFVGETKIELYKLTPENGEVSWVSGNLFDRVKDIFDLDSVENHHNSIHLHPNGDWPVMIAPDNQDVVAIIAPRIMR